MSVAGPAAQGRASVAFRVILVIPHLFVLYVLGAVASVVAVIGWFGALVTGRLPGFAAAYLSGYVRWYSRVAAYLLLLTGAYPPFSFSGGDYPVRVDVSPGRLNRLTVAFRAILAIPAAIVAMVLASGAATIVAFIAWLIALAAGKLPESLHQAFAAVLRYTVRYYCYAYLLTGSYPGGLFGDPGHSAPDRGYPGWGYPDPGYRAPASGYRAQPASWDLVLSSGARRLVVLFIVLGLLTVAAEGAAGGAALVSIRQREIAISQLNAAITRHNGAVASEQQTADQVSSALTRLTAAKSTLDSKVNAAVNSSDASCLTVGCFDTADATAARDNAAFGRALRAISFPAGTAAAADKLVAATAANKRAWRNMSRAVSLEDGVTRATQAEKYGKKFDNAYLALVKALNREATALNQRAGALNREAAALTRRGAALNVPVTVRTPHLPSAPSAT